MSPLRRRFYELRGSFMKTFSVCAAATSAVLVSLVVSSAACVSAAAPGTGGDAGATGPSGTEKDASPAPSVDAGVITVDAGPACNGLAASAPPVNYTLSSQGSPAAVTGGTVADGTYDLTSYTIYGAGSVGGGFVANQATSVTLVIAGTSWNQVQVFDIENTTSTVSTNWAAAVSGTSAITLTPSCPQGAPATNATYEATDSALQLIYSTGGFTVSETFAKQ
jgi:hypothetical protein